MALFVYITDECLQDAKQYSHEREINSFAERIQKEQRTTYFDNFPPPYLKKRFKRQIRLLAAERYVDDHVIVCFYRLMVRSGKPYQAFLNSPKDYGDENFLPLINDEKLHNWLNNKLKDEVMPEKPSTNDIDNKFLWEVVSASEQTGKELIVCESGDWVEAVNQKKLKNKLILLINTILSMCDNELPDTFEVPVERKEGWYILARYFKKHNKLLLISPLIESTDINRKYIKEKYAEILEKNEDELTDHDILKYSARAYPSEILLDDDIWLAVEQDNAANLALSPEEAEILKSAHAQSDNQGVGYPLFINGRAGSGKSTILQYLYADYLQVYISSKDNGQKGPLYLTCSSDLLERSRSTIESLLKCNHKYAQRYHHVDDKFFPNGLSDIKDCFKEFHLFLYNKLKKQERVEHFHKNKYVDFSKFKKLWRDKYAYDNKALKEYSADLSWHVIRTYIKGLSLDGYLDAEEYNELPIKEKTVTVESFDKIYNKVWKNWYSELCEDSGFWDDQDLVRHLLAEDYIKPEHPVIFCDEAQDFTRLELEAILRLSVFSNRNLTLSELNRVPFAFAGDPFQTLNPTGFRWEAIKSAFVVQFIHALHPSRENKSADLNYKELTFNYRSTKNIVRLCNSIQALRACLFDIKSIEPQTSWQYESSSPLPVWFNRGDSIVIDVLKKESDITIIVPCEEGEETAFVNDDKFLKSFVKIDDAGVPQNVLSASRSKGLEFNRVVLYGFGLHSPDGLLDPLISGTSFASDPDIALPKEYFINRLYVAASRAKRRLFIIDSPEGFDNLWKFVTDEALHKGLIDALKNAAWKEHIGTLQPGDEKSWLEDKDDISMIAERYEREGMNKKDPYLLRSAAMSYQNINNELKAKICRAKALQYEQKYKDAGILFEECESFAEAVSSYWQGQHFKNICKLAKKQSKANATLEHRFADIIENGGSSLNVQRQLDKLVSRIDKENLSTDQHELWNYAAGQVIDYITGIQISKDDKLGIWNKIDKSISQLRDSGFEFGDHIVARVKYKKGDLVSALQLWEKSGMESDLLYRKAKVEKLSADFDNRSMKGVSEKDINLLLDFYIKHDDISNALDLIKKHGNAQMIKNLSNFLMKHGSDEHLLKAFTVAAEKLIDIGAWDEVISIFTKGKLRGVKGIEKRNKKIIKSHKWEFLRPVTSRLAVSDLLVEAATKDKMIISDLLKKWYVTSGFEWAEHLSPDIIGAALERAGRDIDCLQYYENVFASHLFDEKQKERAKNRWVKCKLKQAEREKRDNKPTAEKHEKEAEEKVLDWKIKNIQSVPLYPNISGFEKPVPTEKKSKAKEKTGSSKADTETKLKTEDGAIKPEKIAQAVKSCTFSVGEFSIVKDSSTERIKIQKGPIDSATINIPNLSCSSVDVKFTADQNIFSCEEWSMICDLSKVDNDKKLIIKLFDYGVDVHFDV